MNELIAIGLFLVPVLFAIIFSKGYNIIHGIVTFIFVAYLEVFFAGMFPAFNDMFVVGGTNYLGLYSCVIAFINANTLDRISALATLSWATYAYLAVYVVLFLILHIIASAMARSRKRKINNLKQQSRRY